MVSLARPGRSGRDVIAAVAGTVVCASPVFLVGALAVQVRASLHFGASALGVVAALYYLGAGISSIPLGRATDALGGLRMMRIAALVSAMTLLAVALFARSLTTLALVMVPAGIASAAMQPAANVFLSRRVAKERQGLAFGIKQSAVPLAAMLGGLAVPAIALTIGWRFAFVLVGLLALGVALGLPRPRQSLSARRSARSEMAAPPLVRGPVVVLALGLGLGVASAGALTAFLVSSAVAGGLGRSEAGMLAAFGGAVAVASRILVGKQADRRARAHLPRVALFLALGALGYGALALISARHLLAWYFPVVAVVFAAGWGWNGLFNFALIRTHPEQAAHVTGITQAGGRFGGMLGPLAFGMIVDHTSYGLAWLVTGLTAITAAATVMVGRHLLTASRQHTAPLLSPPERSPAVGS